MYKFLFFFAVAAIISGCSTILVPAITPYKIDIQQGNYVKPEALAKIQPGMSKSQVRFVLGTPLLTDPFHANRWDYVYRYQQRGRLIEDHRVSLLFEGDILKKIDTDIEIPAAEILPTAAPVATPSSAEPAGTVQPATAAPIVSP